MYLESCHPDLKAGAFLTGVRCFKARRGVPSQIIHDNAKTFKATAVKQYIKQIGKAQRFILPAFPWWGGRYKLLVKSAKATLEKMLLENFKSS